MDDSLSIIEEEMEQLSVTTGEILPSHHMSSPPSVRNGDEQWQDTNLCQVSALHWLH